MQSLGLLWSKESPLRVFEVVGLRGRTSGSFRNKDSPWKVFEVVDLRGQA